MYILASGGLPQRPRPFIYRAPICTQMGTSSLRPSVSSGGSRFAKGGGRTMASARSVSLNGGLGGRAPGGGSGAKPHRAENLCVHFHTKSGQMLRIKRKTCPVYETRLLRVAKTNAKFRSVEGGRGAGGGGARSAHTWIRHCSCPLGIRTLYIPGMGRGVRKGGQGGHIPPPEIPMLKKIRFFC